MWRNSGLAGDGGHVENRCNGGEALKTGGRGGDWLAVFGGGFQPEFYGDGDFPNEFLWVSPKLEVAFVVMFK